MRILKSTLSAGLVVSGLLAISCGSSSRSSGFEPEKKAETPGGDTGLGNGDPALGNGQNKAEVPVSFSGTVFAPNGSLPMANTLVYITAKEPAPIPEGAYCDECVTLDEGTFAMSAPDGKFEITTNLPKGDAWVVVQKGQFRRVTKIAIEKEGDLKIGKDLVTLPGKADPSKGDTVPKMVVLKDDSDFDQIDESLKKLGITDFETKTDRSLLDDEAALMKYQVVFIPCGSSDDAHASGAQSKANLQAFVAAGGKLYVTDWSYEFVRQPFTGYLNWAQESNTLGSAATGDEWDAPANAQDQGLNDWLAATGDKSFQVQGNWTTINAVNTMPGKDAKGNDVQIEPKVWVTATKGGQNHPTTVSFENQCGRVLFSTYHTEPDFGGSSTLHAQEKALLYVLLEVGVCISGTTVPK